MVLRMLGGVCMYLKRIVVLATFIILAFAFSLSAYAMPEENQDDFFETFQLNKEELQTNIDEDNLGLYVILKDGSSIRQTEDEDINDYNFFKVNKGFSRTSVVTFADTKIFSGNGDVDTLVGIVVLNSKGNTVDTSDPVQIGASGVFNASIRFDLGENNVVFVVKKGDLTLYRLFKVTVKEEQKKEILENIQLNFMPVTENKVEEKSSSKPFSIYNFLGTSGK